MEVRKIAIGKENPMTPLTGSSVKRKRLSDITNTVSSSISDAQFQEKSEVVNFIVTKDLIQQIMEENARLLKTLGERNKIIEFTNMELQKLRIMLEKANQQNRLLAQANSQMLSELTLSKERLKAFQHELGCMMAVLKSKNSELDEKNKLNKELIEKIRIQVESSKFVEFATEGRQIGNSMTCRLDGNSQLDEEKLNNEHCEESKAMEDDNYAVVASGISLLHPISNSRACIPKKNTRRIKALGSTTLSDAGKPNNEHDNIRSEVEHSECSEVATDASLSHPADNNVVCEPNGVGADATVTHQVQVKEKGTRRSSRRISNILATEAHESNDYLFEVVHAEIPDCSVMSEPPYEVEAKEGEDTRTRKSLRRSSNTLKSETCGSKGRLHGSADVKNPTFSTIIEPPNEAKTNVLTKLKDGNAQEDQIITTTTSECQGQEARGTSVGRPMRKAAGKVSSYKEIPINVKMRRPASLPQ